MVPLENFLVFFSKMRCLFATLQLLGEGPYHGSGAGRIMYLRAVGPELKHSEHFDRLCTFKNCDYWIIQITRHQIKGLLLCNY